MENTFKYIPSNYPDSFICNMPYNPQMIMEKADHVIYTFWTGDNEMSENRKNSLKTLIENSGVEVKLITPKELPFYILPDFPLHPAYTYLSLVHKSDYLRAYFMMHHGGGYSDVKACTDSWKGSFERLNPCADKWALGARESEGGVPVIPGRIGTDTQKFVKILLRNCCYIFRPRTPLSVEWMAELHYRLDSLLPELVKYPGNIYGDNEYYPVPWSYVLGQIFHPLVLKYNSFMLYEQAILPVLRFYR